MLQIFGFVYGLVTLIAGKFWLGKGRVATGNPARVAGAVLVAPFPIALCLGLVLGVAGVPLDRMTSMLIELPLLIASLVIAFRIAGKAAKAQASGQNAGQSAGQFQAPTFAGQAPGQSQATKAA